METMIDNIKKYRDDFKGTRIPKFEEKFVKERILITNKQREKELKEAQLEQARKTRIHDHSGKG